VHLNDDQAAVKTKTKASLQQTISAPFIDQEISFHQ